MGPHNLAVWHLRELLFMVGLTVIALALFVANMFALSMPMMFAMFKGDLAVVRVEVIKSRRRARSQWGWRAYLGVLMSCVLLGGLLLPVAHHHAMPHVIPILGLLALGLFASSLLLTWYVARFLDQPVPQSPPPPAPTDAQTWPPPPHVPQSPLETRQLFLYGVSRTRVECAAQALQVQVLLVNNVAAAEVIVALKTNYRKEPTKLQEGISRNIPVFFISSNVYLQIENALREVFSLPLSGRPEEHPTASALEQRP